MKKANTQTFISTDGNALTTGTDGKVYASEYDKYIVAFSGGKDSTACFLRLLDIGIPKEKIELWHHLVDGRESDAAFMDWSVTEDYCRKFAEAFDVPIYFSWREGGFRREMMRLNQSTGKVLFETPDGEVRSTGGSGPKGTRQKFPQVSPDLSIRWCSAYLKIDVCRIAIRNQSRFEGIKTVLISGERGEESPARAEYADLEIDRCDARNGKKQRYVDRWRPIKNWTEEQVWKIIEDHGVVVHPCYYMGWSRCSCKFCIFGNADQFASAYMLSPDQGLELISMEHRYGVTMKREENLTNLIARGSVYQSAYGKKDASTYTGSIFTTQWKLPAGAYGEGCGPT